MTDFFNWIIKGLLGQEAPDPAAAPNGYHPLADAETAIELGYRDAETAAREQFIGQAEEFYEYARTPFQKEQWDTNVGLIRIYDDDSQSYWYWMLESHPVARLIRCNSNGVGLKRIKKAGLIAFREQEVRAAFDLLEDLSSPIEASGTQTQTTEPGEVPLVPNSNNGASIMTPLIVQGDKKDD